MTSRAGKNILVSQEADNLETMIDALPLYGFQRTKVWDAWAEHGMASALDMLAKYKTSYKEAAATHPLDPAIVTLKAAYDQGDQQAAAGAIKQLVTACTAAPVATKAARPTLDNLLDGVSGHLQRNGGLS